MTALELTPAEQAAMRTDLHATTCPVPLGECVECMSTLRTVRKVIAAVTPVIEEQVTKPLKERLEAAELVCDIFGAAGWAGLETERTRATEQAWQDWFSAYGAGVRTPDDVITALAARREEIRAQTVARIREQLEHSTPRHSVPEDGIDSDGAPVAAASDPERSGAAGGQ